MNKQTELKNPKECVKHIAALFRAIQTQPESGSCIGPVSLSVREDISFENSWLKLGEVFLHPAAKDKDEEEYAPAENAVSLGFYDWEMESFVSLRQRD